MTFDELKAALDIHNVVWIDHPAQYGSTDFKGYFQRMGPDGTMLRASVWLTSRQAPMLRDHVENIYRRLQIIPDTDTPSWH